MGCLARITEGNEKILQRVMASSDTLTKVRHTGSLVPLLSFAAKFLAWFEH